LTSAIKRLCKSKRIPIYELEDKLGLSRTSISRWDKNSPSVDKVKKVADFLGVTVDELLKG
jgi:transcriptional regulator with XRE-family HTH domain